MQLHADVVVMTVDRANDPYRAGRWAIISLHDKRGIIPTVEAVLHLKLAPEGDPTDDIMDAVQLLTRFVGGGGPVEIFDGGNAFRPPEVE